MKKSPKKLRLSRETVLHLNQGGLRRVVGGYVTGPGFTECTNNAGTETGYCASATCFPQASVPFGSCACQTSVGDNACICDVP